jgi:hypothetical protein
MLAALPASAAHVNQTNVTTRGATVFIGESGLNITPVVAGTRTIAWFPSTAVPDSTVPEKTIDVTNSLTSFQINPTDFPSRTGNWYCWTNGKTLGGVPIAFIVADPSLTLAIWDLDQDKDISGKSVPAGERVTFKIDTNLYTLTTPTTRHTPGQLMFGIWADCMDPATPANQVEPADGDVCRFTAADIRNGTFYGFNNTGFYMGNRSTFGFIDIKVKTPDGATLTTLYNSSLNTPDVPARGLAVPLTGLIVTSQPWYWGNATRFSAATGLANTGTSMQLYWNTSSLDVMGHRIYPSGTYTVTAEINIHGIKDNYKNAGADYTGKTVSEAKTLTLTADTVKIEADKDSVVRSKPFSVTVTGRPSTVYYLWVKGTRALDGTFDNQPPMLLTGQAGMLNDTAPYAYARNAPANWEAAVGGKRTASVWYGQYAPQNAPAIAPWLTDQASPFPYNSTLYYTALLTNDAGVRTLQWMTNNMTKAQRRS